MQYRGYEIQIVQSGSIIRKSNGEFIIEVSDEKEAKEYVDEIIDEERKELEDNLYEKFIRYCKNLPNKHFIEGKLCSYNENVLKNLAKSFEETNNAEVKIISEFYGGEYRYIVESVNKIM